MAVISTLVARMICDLMGWTPNMEKAKRQMSEFGMATKALRGTLARLGVGFSAAGVVLGALNLSKRAEETLDMARGLGMTADSYQRLRYIMVASGGDASDLASGMFQMIRRVEASKNGIDETSKTFRQFGVTVEDMRKDPLQVIRSITKHISDMGLKTTAAKQSFDTMGRAAKGMFPVFSGGITNFDKLSKEADRYKIILSDVQLMQAQVFSRAWAKGKELISTKGTGILGELTLHLQSMYIAFSKMGSLGRLGVLGSGGYGGIYFAGKTRDEKAKLLKQYEDEAKASNAANADMIVFNETMAAQIDAQKEWGSVMNKFMTPLEKYNEEVEILSQNWLMAGKSLEEWAAANRKLELSFIESQWSGTNKWAESLLDEAAGPMDKYKKKLNELANLMLYLEMIGDDTAENLAQVQSLAEKALNEASTAMKPERARHSGGSFGELSPLSSMTGMQVGESIEQVQVQKMAEIVAILRAYLPQYGLN
jgi:hypothetical protein